MARNCSVRSIGGGAVSVVVVVVVGGGEKGVRWVFGGRMGKEAVEKMKRSRGLEAGEWIIREVWETVPCVFLGRGMLVRGCGLWT